MHCPETHLCEVYAFIVSVMYKQKLLFVPHQQLLLCRVPFFSVPPLGRETAPGFLRPETSKHCLTWTLQPCQWHLPSTLMAAESLCWIRCVFFLSLLGFAKEKKTNSLLLPASTHSPTLVMLRCLSGSFSPATGTHLISSASPPALALLPRQT